MTHPSPTAPALVADIGGTNTRVALADGVSVRQASIRRYANAEFSDLESVLRRYLDETATASVSGVCVAAAGPVRDGVASMTNLDWTITGPGLTAATGTAHTAILNDLQAQGHALGRIGHDDRGDSQTLKGRQPRGPIGGQGHRNRAAGGQGHARAAGEEGFAINLFQQFIGAAHARGRTGGQNENFGDADFRRHIPLMP